MARDDSESSLPSSDDLDEAFSALAARQRREILCLLARDRVDSVSDLVERSDDGAVDPEIALLHVHLPKLAEAGYVDWNRESGEVSKGPRFAEVRDLQERMESRVPDPDER